MKIPALFAIALTMSVSAFGQTTAPAAPTLTAGGDFKGLQLDWDAVPGATSYQLQYRAHPSSPWVVQYPDFPPATPTTARLTFPLHFYDWTYARYRVAACNSEACTWSSELSVSNLRRDAVGYFKSSQPAAGAYFGSSTSMSPDGYYFVTAAPEEAITTNGGRSEGGAVYVFQRRPDGTWFQRTRIEPHATFPTDLGTGLDVSISASGRTVAVGMPEYVTDEGGDNHGVVDIYRRNDSNVWTRTRIERPASAFAFGSGATLDESGFVLATRILDNENSIAIFKNINGTWQNVRLLSLHDQGYAEECNDFTMSRNGLLIAEACLERASATRPERWYIRIHTGANWNSRYEIPLPPPTADGSWTPNVEGVDRTGSTITVTLSNAPSYPDNTGDAQVRVYTRLGNTWQNVAVFKPGTWRQADEKYLFGSRVAVSGDGQTIAVGDTRDNGTGWGPRAAPLVGGTAATGAVYVYRRSSTGNWSLVNMVKPNYNPDPDGLTFPWGVLLSGTGKTLLVPSPYDSSSASGIGGDWANQDRDRSGAIFLY
jgi:hypothetical protein